MTKLTEYWGVRKNLLIINMAWVKAGNSVPMSSKISAKVGIKKTVMATNTMTAIDPTVTG